MSNPGVITLASLRNSGPNIERLDIEDNIGEAIHIHWNGLRIDLTVRDFLQLAEDLAGAERPLMASSGFSRDHFDPYFLFRMGPWVSRIERIDIEERRLKDLSCLVNVRIPRLGFFKLPRPVERTPAYQFLTGAAAAFREYEQDTYPGMTNEARILSIAESIRTLGYPDGHRHIVLFGDQNYVRDGQHRAAALAAINGLDSIVKVKVIHLRGHGWRIRPYYALLRRIVRAIIVGSARRATAFGRR